MIDEKQFNEIKPGVKVRVYEEKGSFEGLILGRKHGSESGSTFTVRAIIKGVGVEKVYPLHSPTIKKIEIVSKPKRVRRAKLYFVRDLSGKKIRKKLGVSI